MSEQVLSQQPTKRVLPRLVGQCERLNPQVETQPPSIGSDGPLEDRNDRNPGATCAQALTPPLPAGYNPYFDLPPV